MAYFVTGATGFIGSYLVANLVERSGPIYVLVRQKSLDRLAELREAWGVDDKRIIAIVGDLGKPKLGVSRRRPPQAQGQGRPLLPSGRHLRPAGIGGRPASGQCRRHAPRRRVRDGDHRRMLPPCELDRRSRPLRGRLPRGHVRGGRGARPSVFPHQARRRARRAPRMQAAISHLPARLRRRRLEDGPDRQDRRSVLLLQVDPEDARDPAAVDADDRHRRRPHQHRSGGLRRRRARLSRAPEGPRRPLLPPDGPAARIASARC